MITTFEREEIVRRAREDARLGVYGADEYIAEKLGPEPRFDPVNNLAHAQTASRLQQDPVVDEGHADIRREEEELTRHPPIRFAIGVILALLGIELVSTLHTLKEAGFMMPERAVFGAALGVGIFAIAWYAGRTHDPLRLYATYLVLGVVVFATASIRSDASEGNTGWASGLLLVAGTIGPAILAERFLRAIEPTLPILRRVHAIRRQIAPAASATSSARREVRAIEHKRERWQRESQRRKAIYDVAHRAERMQRSLGTPTSANAPTPMR